VVSCDYKYLLLSGRKTVSNNSTSDYHMIECSSQARTNPSRIPHSNCVTLHIEHDASYAWVNWLPREQCFSLLYLGHELCVYRICRFHEYRGDG